MGKPFPWKIVRQWKIAAPNSEIENLYGPTELTVACTRYHWNDFDFTTAMENGIVPIGEPFPGLDSLVVNEKETKLNAGTRVNCLSLAHR